MASISIATMTLLSAGVLAGIQLFQWLSPAMWRVRKLSRCNSSTIDRYRGWSEDTKARSLAHGPLTTSPLIGMNPVWSRSETGTSRHAQPSCKGSKRYKRPPHPLLRWPSGLFVAALASYMFLTGKLRTAGHIRHDTFTMAHRFGVGLACPSLGLCIDGQPFRCRSSAIRISAKSQHGSCRR